MFMTLVVVVVPLEVTSFKKAIMRLDWVFLAYEASVAALPPDGWKQATQVRRGTNEDNAGSLKEGLCSGNGKRAACCLPRPKEGPENCLLRKPAHKRATSLVNALTVQLE